LKGRSLTKAERALAESVFGTAIALDDVKLVNRKWWWFQPRSIVMAPRGNIHFHPKSDQYCDDFCDQHLTDQGLFIHEMTHVWQHQQGVFLPIARHPFCRYDYSLKPGWTLKRYGIEQQAEIVRHYFMLKNGYPLAGALPLDVYESIIPFGK
jgi:hypothetical protein